MPALPTIDLTDLRSGPHARRRLASRIDRACREVGFFTVTGHGLDPQRLAELDRLSRAFFALPVEEQSAIAMAHGGRAWRGWFPLDGELTAGRADHKSGVYFGRELPDDDPRVRARRLLHGANLFPRRPSGWRAAVLGWIELMERLGQQLLELIACGLGLPDDAFRRTITADPTVLFRIFHYPAGLDGWGVGEHTDYGLLTILAQDDRGGLEVHTPDGWIAVPGDPTALVVNVGDMLELLTGGRYRSTPHRVRNTSGADRLSFPFFLDPSWEAVVRPLDLPGEPSPEHRGRWDGADLRTVEGTYGEYLLAKVTKVFPVLADAVAAETDRGRAGRGQP